MLMHCMLQGIISAQCLPVTRLTGTGHHQHPSYICLSVAMLTVTRHHQCPMPPCYKAHCCKASSVPYASLLQGPLVQGIISTLAIYAFLLQCSLLQGIISALCLPVTRLTAARHHQCPMPPCYKAHWYRASSAP